MSRASARNTAQSEAISGGDRLLYLTDDKLRQSAELMFFAYRAFTSDPDEILRSRGFWRAHHRVLHFIGARRSLAVGDLMDILAVTKQSLNRVLRELIDRGLVEQRVDEIDRRKRLLALTDEGAALEQSLAEAQRARLRTAFLEAGPDAVDGFRQVLERMLDADERDRLKQFIAGEASNAGADSANGGQND